MKNTIFIRVDSGQHIGYGHMIRCLALAGNLKNFFNIIFLTTNYKGNINSLIKKNNYKLIQLKKTKTNQSKIKIKLDAEQTIKIINKIGNEKSLLLVDNYELSSRWESMVKPFVNKIIVIDDLISRKHNCDLIIDQNLHTNMQKLYVNCLPKKCIRLFGPSYVILRKQFLQEKKFTKKRKLPIKKILITFGGSDYQNHTLLVLNNLKNIDTKKTVFVVVGKAHSNKKSIKSFCKKFPYFEYIEQTNDMAKLIRMSDLSIGSGGTTTWERCFLGLPSIIIITSNDQKDIAHAISKNKCGINIGKINTSTKMNLNDIIQNFKSNDFENMSKKCMNLVDGKGVIRITKEIRKLS